MIRDLLAIITGLSFAVGVVALGSCATKPSAPGGDYAAQRDADVARCLRFCEGETVRIIWYADGGQECSCVGSETLDR
jgi:hypothetical protein